MFLENQRRYIRQITETVNYSEPDVGIVFGNYLDDRSLCEADTDN